MSAVVYFAQEGTNGPIKIGWTRNVSERMTNIAVGNSKRLHVLHTIPGGPALELHIHEMLAPYRVRGEWFRPEADVFDIIEKAKRFGAAFFGAGYVEPDLGSLFEHDRASGTTDDIARMLELANDIADHATKDHRQKARVTALSRCLSVSYNRAFEFLCGRARRIESWEMRRAEDVLVALMARREVGSVEVQETAEGETR